MIVTMRRKCEDGCPALLATAATIVWVLVFAAMQGFAGQDQNSGQTDSKQTAPQSTPRSSNAGALPNHAIDIGGGYGDYSGGLGPSNGESIRLSLGKYRAYRWVFDFGRQYRFGVSSVGAGVTYFRSLPRDITVNIGAGTGTGKILAPKYSFGMGASKPILGIVTSVSYTRVQSKVVNGSDGVGVGLMRYQRHWIATAGAHVDVGHPGNTKSPGFNFGLSYYVYRKTYVGVGTDFGRASYMLVSTGRTLVNYTGHGYNFSLLHWISPRRGFNLRLNYGETSFYTVWGITLSLFQEW